MDRHKQRGVRGMNLYWYPLARAWAYFVVSIRNQKTIGPHDVIEEAQEVANWIIEGDTPRSREE